MTRRELLQSSALAAAAVVARAEPKQYMGIATTCFMTARRPKDTLEFLEYARTLGAAGVQSQLSSKDPAYIRKVRETAERNGMYVEIMAPLPGQDAAAFEQTVAAAKESGAVAIRVGCLSGRRYETFSTLDEWKTWADKARDSVLRAVPVVERHKMPMALENHKDWTSAELAAFLRQISSEYAGACLDTGNNISLLEDPYDVVETLAPFTLATHVKDMAMRQAEEGFDLSEMPFGDGVLDMKRIIKTIAAARPKTRITLEMITRDPLRVPCLTTKYWATFPDRSGYVLARTLAFIRQNPKKELPRVSGLDREALLREEEQNVRKCLNAAASYA